MTEIAIYNENCVLAGEEVSAEILEQTPQSADWTYWPVSEASRKVFETNAKDPGGSGAFGRRCLATIEAAIALP